MVISGCWSQIIIFMSIERNAGFADGRRGVVEAPAEPMQVLVFTGGVEHAASDDDIEIIVPDEERSYRYQQNGRSNNLHTMHMKLNGKKSSWVAVV